MDMEFLVPFLNLTGSSSACWEEAEIYTVRWPTWTDPTCTPCGWGLYMSLEPREECTRGVGAVVGGDGQDCHGNRQ